MSESSPVPVTVVIAARNELPNILECIRSVSWASEVIVADGGSTDGTVNVAEAAGARVLKMTGLSIGAQRNKAIETAANEWIFVIDADERASAVFGAEIAGAVQRASRDAFRVGRENVFLGRVIQHGGWESERDRPIRLFRKRLRYDDSLVHERVLVAGEIGELSATLRHIPYATLGQFFEKLDRYSGWWAKQNFDRGRRAGAATVIAKPFARFLSAFVIRGGWRDGPRGAVLAGLGAVSVLAKYARLWELGLRDAGRRT